MEEKREGEGSARDGGRVFGDDLWRPYEESVTVVTEKTAF